MATATQFEDLGVWQYARGLVIEIHRTSKQRAIHCGSGLREQIRRAAGPTISNIVEGFERGSRKEFIQFLDIAEGSNGEVRSQLYIALDQACLSAEDFAELKAEAMSLSRRLARFITHLERCPSPRRRKTK